MPIKLDTPLHYYNTLLTSARLFHYLQFRSSARNYRRILPIIKSLNRSVQEPWPLSQVSYYASLAVHGFDPLQTYPQTSTRTTAYLVRSPVSVLLSILIICENRILYTDVNRRVTAQYFKCAISDSFVSTRNDLKCTISNPFVPPREKLTFVRGTRTYDVPECTSMTST
jgi:hypothetical protein